MSDLVTFIVPVLNGEASLGRCLDSIRRQTYKHFEIIVVDNGSTDDTKKIAQSHPDVRYLYVYEKGRSRARNAGASLANGDYLCFVDCDVVLEVDWLEKCVGYLMRIPVDALATQVIPKGSQKSLVDSYRYFFADWKSHSTFLSLKKRKTLYPVINTAACVMRKDSYNLVGGFNEKLLRNEDLELSLRFYLGGFLLGGTTEAKSWVDFNSADWNIARNLSYLKRGFDVHSSGLFKTSRIYSINTNLIKAIWKHSSRKYALAWYAIAVEMFSFTGAVVSSTSRQSALDLASHELKRGKSAMLFSHFVDGKLIVPRPGVNFLFVEDVAYYSQYYNLDNLTPLQGDESTCFHKLMRQEVLGDRELEILKKLDLFESYSC